MSGSTSLSRAPNRPWVAEEARNRDVAAVVDDRPFRRFGLKPGAIGPMTVQPEIANPPLYALAYLD
jgi:hypothetical protein